MNKEERRLKKLARKKRNNPLWQLNAQIKRLRMQYRLNTKEFGSILQMSPESIEKRENDELFWRYEIALRIAHNFGKTLKIEIVDRQ